MTRLVVRVVVALAGAVGALALSIPAATAHPAATARPGATAQASATTYLALADASAWVDPEGSWRVEWTVVAEPPPDATLRYTIHQAISGPDSRRRVDAALEEGELGPNLRNSEAVPFAQLRSGTGASIEVPVRSRQGSSERAFLPNAGIHPVEVSLVAADGSELQTMVLFLNRLPGSSPPALRVAPLLRVEAPPLIPLEGVAPLPPAVRSSVADADALLEAFPELPITVRLDPEVVDAARVSPDPTDGTHLAAFLGNVGERPVLRSSWAPMDLESWATRGSLSTFQTAVLAGQRSLTSALDRTPDGGVWAPDPSLGPRSVSWLSAVGVQHVVLEADQVAPTRDLGDDAGTTQRFAVESADSGIDALVVDPDLAARLAAAPDADAPLAAHHAATELEAMWFAAPADATPAAVVDLTDVPADVATAFLSTLSIPNPSVAVASVSDAFDAATSYSSAPRRRGDPLVRKLVHDGELIDVSAISRELSRLRDRANSYRSSIAAAQDRPSLESLLLAVQHRGLDLADQLTFLAAAGRRIDAGLATVVPEARSFTVTARRSELPIRITNDGDREVTVLLRFGGTRLQVNGGRPLRSTLQPGPNTIVVPVLARTSGEFTMRVEVRTADDALLLGSSEIRIRSTVVSGAGVVLAIGALSFLLVWWGATIRRDRRRRREEAEGDDAHAEGAPPRPAPASIA